MGFCGCAPTWAGHKNAVLELHWTSDGERILSASPDKSVRAWDVATGNQVCAFPVPSQSLEPISSTLAGHRKRH